LINYSNVGVFNPNTEITNEKLLEMINYLILKSEKLLSLNLDNNQNEKYLTIFEEFTNLLQENYQLSKECKLNIKYQLYVSCSAFRY
jgi:hypothetical protein